MHLMPKTQNITKVLEIKYTCPFFLSFNNMTLMISIVAIFYLWLQRTKFTTSIEISPTFEINYFNISIVVSILIVASTTLKNLK